MSQKRKINKKSAKIYARWWRMSSASGLTLVDRLKTLASEHVMYNDTEAIAGVIRK